MTRLASQTTLTQPSPKRLLLDKLQELTAAVEALPDDVFGDGPGRHKAQGLAKSVNAALEAPKESIFKILFQVERSLPMKPECLNTDGLSYHSLIKVRLP